MTPIRTWLEIRGEIKEELGVQSENAVSVDDLLLALANEALIQIAQSGKDLREFRLDKTYDIANITNLVIEDIAIVAIDQVYYQRFVAGTLTLRWDISEQAGLVGPPAVVGFPNSYTIKQQYLSADFVRYTITFYPINKAAVGDKIQIIGAGFQYIVDATSTMPYPTLYTWIKLFIIERYKNHRGDTVEKIKVTNSQLNAAGAAATTGTSDRGNNENSKPK